MMNIKEEDVNLGCTKFSIHTKLLRTSGAGVNADSRVNLAFATSDPLSELVWSPCNGLSLKCATSAAADNKPFRLWNLGLNCSGDQANFTIPQTLLHADDMIIDKPALLTSSQSRPPPELGPTHPDCDGCKSFLVFPFHHFLCAYLKDFNLVKFFSTDFQWRMMG